VFATPTSGAAGEKSWTTSVKHFFRPPKPKPVTIAAIVPANQACTDDSLASRDAVIDAERVAYFAYVATKEATQWFKFSKRPDALRMAITVNLHALQRYTELQTFIGVQHDPNSPYHRYHGLVVSRIAELQENLKRCGKSLWWFNNLYARFSFGTKKLDDQALRAAASTTQVNLSPAYSNNWLAAQLWREAHVCDQERTQGGLDVSPDLGNLVYEHPDFVHTMLAHHDHTRVGRAPVTNTEEHDEAAVRTMTIIASQPAPTGGDGGPGNPNPGGAKPSVWKRFKGMLGFGNGDGAQA